MFDPRICTKNLGIPVRTREIDKRVGGYTNMVYRCIVISKEHENNTRVWVHEIAHALLDYRDAEDAMRVGTNKDRYARSEICADTTAYIVCSILGCADKEEYTKYMDNYINDLNLEHLTKKFFDEILPICKETARKILISGGYYHE